MTSLVKDDGVDLSRSITDKFQLSEDCRGVEGRVASAEAFVYQRQSGLAWCSCGELIFSHRKGKSKRRTELEGSEKSSKLARSNGHCAVFADQGNLLSKRNIEQL